MGRSVSLTADSALIVTGIEPSSLNKRNAHLSENSGKNLSVMETENSDVEFYERVTKVSCHFLRSCVAVYNKLYQEQGKSC